MYIFTVLPPSAQLVHMGLVICTTDQAESTAVGYRDQLSPGQGVAAIFDQHSGYLAISYFKKRRMKKKKAWLKSPGDFASDERAGWLTRYLYYCPI